VEQVSLSGFGSSKWVGGKGKKGDNGIENERTFEGKEFQDIKGARWTGTVKGVTVWHRGDRGG